MLTLQKPKYRYRVRSYAATAPPTSTEKEAMYKSARHTLLTSKLAKPPTAA